MKTENKIKGDLLEEIYFMFEKCLPGLKKNIVRKAVLNDQFEIKREIDILIEYKIDNYKTGKIAIECKNHVSKIPIKEITDFYSKIEGLGIQGFFVTTSSFQKGAIKMAKKRNIELFYFKKESSKSAIKQNIAIRKMYDIKNMSWNFSSDDYNEDELMTIADTKEFKIFLSKLLKKIQINLNYNLDAMIQERYPEWVGIQNRINYVGVENGQILSGSFNFKDVKFISNDKSITINELNLELLVYEECKVMGNMQDYTFNLYNNSTHEMIASINPSYFTIDGIEYKGSLIHLPNEPNAYKMSVVSSEKFSDINFEDVDNGFNIENTFLKDFLDKFQK